MTEQQQALHTRTVPTMYFIGVTTGQSSIMKVFPKWSGVLGLGAEIVGYDAALMPRRKTTGPLCATSRKTRCRWGRW
jgi:hypothetical protein